MSERAGRKTLAAVIVTAAIALPLAALALGSGSAGQSQLLHADSQGVYVHRVNLYDDDGQVIEPSDPEPRQYSVRHTCGKCHAYATVGGGWHFNAPLDVVSPGRRGQPWILTDATTGTQMPVSSRDWPGAISPARAGLSAWDMVMMFGRHMHGGGYGELGQLAPADPKARWEFSGPLEIDCLNCHDAGRSHDQSVRQLEIRNQNFRWLPTASGDLGRIVGEARQARQVPEPFMPASPDNPWPMIEYNESRFDKNSLVFFDIIRQGPADNCYFCHSVRQVGLDAPAKWQRDTDVHLAAGLTCTDCHRNGLDHLMVRGYEGESSDPQIASLSCRGCHYGAGDVGPLASGGRLRAPRPRHKGLPTLHLDKLSCTACHSGPMPSAVAGRVQTSRAHELGLGSMDRSAETPPYIREPVFIRQDNGQIAPHRAFWPAYWGRVNGEAIEPVPNEMVLKVAPKDDKGKPRPLTAEDVPAVLTALETRLPAEGGKIVYVSGGQVHSLESGKLVSTVHPAAALYAWPIAHDVRPASQSLGAADCTECHSSDSPVFFGTVLAESIVNVNPPREIPMHELEQLDPRLQRMWGLAYQGRPWLKVVGFSSLGVLALVLLAYGLLGVVGLLRRLGPAGQGEGE